MTAFTIALTIALILLFVCTVGMAIYNSVTRTMRIHRCQMCEYSGSCENKNIKKCDKLKK